jgi:hypothetical protein
MPPLGSEEGGGGLQLGIRARVVGGGGGQDV